MYQGPVDLDDDVGHERTSKLNVDYLARFLRILDTVAYWVA